MEHNEQHKRWGVLRHSLRFAEELQSWVADGLVSEAQAELIAARYGLNDEPPWYRQSGLLLRALGLFIVAMGFFLLIAANWEELPVPLRMLVGLLPLLAAYALGLRAYWQGKERAAELAIIFATLALGANIALQAQIFHISSYFPDGLLWWIIGAVPAMFFFRSAFLHVVFLGLFAMWLGVQNQYYQFSLWAPPLLLAFGFFTWKYPNALALIFLYVALYLFVVASIGVVEQKRLASVYEWALIPLFFGVYNLLFLVLFHFVKHQYSDRVGNLLQGVLQLSLVFFFFVFTFSEAAAASMDEAAKGIPISFFVLLGLAVALYLPQKRTANLTMAFGIVALLAVPPIMGALAPAIAKNHEVAKIFSIVANVLFLAFCGWKIWQGTQLRNKMAFMSGVFYLVCWALGRYLALFGDYVTSSLIFIACGAGIYFLNSFWDRNFKGDARTSKPSQP